MWPNFLFFSSWLWRNRTSKNQLWRHFSNVMAIMSPKNVIKTSQNFSILLPFPNQNLGKAKIWRWSIMKLLFVYLFFDIMPENVSGWCGHGFQSHSQPFLLTYPRGWFKLMTSRLLFSNLIWKLSSLAKKRAACLTV